MEFSELEQKVILMLASSTSRDVDRRVRLEDVEKTLGLEGPSADEEASRFLDSLSSKLKVEHVSLESTDSKVISGERVYWLNPKEVEQALSGLEIFNKEKKDTMLLYLGELGFGTTANDPRAVKGLRGILDYNMVGKKPLAQCLDATILAGGLIPEVPIWYTSTASPKMRMLGKDPELAQLIGTMDDMPEEMREYYKKYIDGKISDKTEAVSFTRKILSELAGGKMEFPIYYAYGEEDAANLRQMFELKLTLLPKYQSLQEDLDNIDTTLTEVNYELIRAKKAFQFLQGIKDNLTLNGSLAQASEGSELEEMAKSEATQPPAAENGNGGKTRPDIKDKISAHLEMNHDTLANLNQEYEGLGDEITSTLSRVATMNGLNSRILHAESLCDKKQAEIDTLTNKRAEYEDRALAVERVSEAAGFFEITKRIELNPLQDAAMWWEVSRDYRKLLQEAHPRLIQLPEQKNLIEINGWYILIEPSVNIKSVEPPIDTLARMKKRSAEMNLRGILVPDVYISSHSRGGFRYQPQTKQRESIVMGEYREPTEIIDLIQLPTFLSAQKLEDLLRHRITKNWKVKMYDQGPFAGGAVIEQLNADQSRKIWFYSMDDLVELGLAMEKIELLTSDLAEEKLAPLETGQAKDYLRELKGRFQFEKKNTPEEKSIMIHLAGDFHMGSQAKLGRPTQYDFIDAIIAYQREHRLPDILMLSENQHGNVERFFSSATNYHAYTPVEINQISDQIKRSGYEPEKKMELLSRLAFWQSALASNPNLDRQNSMIRDVIAPYASEVIERGGIVTAASGNHPNLSAHSKTDEATAFGNLLREGEKQAYYSFDGIGESQGSGALRLKDGRVIYTAHALNKGSDEVIGAIKQAVKSNNKVDFIIGNDLHHCGLGYAEGIGFAISTGLQPITPYVDEIGKQGSVRGLVNVFLSRNPYLSDSFAAQLVLDPTLEQKYMSGNIDLDRILLEEFLPEGDKRRI